MTRQLVICLDGTNNQISADETNILRIYRMLDINQNAVLRFYAAGVGTFGLKEALFEWQKVPAKILGLAFGWGLRRNVEDAYRFISEHYSDNCEIYIFGFSRGAYTARVVAAMIHAIGLLPPHQLNLFDYAWAAMKDRDAQGKPNFKLQTRIKSGFSRRAVKVKFLGLFDTVKSVGWIYEPLILPYTLDNPSVEVVRHAVSIDERRAFFRPNLWSVNPKNTNLKQIWFAGVHSDIGGGYPESESSLAKNALEWMVLEAVEQGLKICGDKYRSIVFPEDKNARPKATGKIHISLKGLWLAAEFVPRIYRKLITDEYKIRLRFPILQWRHLRKPRYIGSNSAVHSSVIKRLMADKTYRPPNLPCSLDQNGEPQYDQLEICINYFDSMLSSQTQELSDP